MTPDALYWIGLISPKVKNLFKDQDGGHDWSHTERVLKNALMIAQNEGGNFTVIAIASLLHDIADSKFHNGDESKSLTAAYEILSTVHCNNQVVEHVLFIIKNMSFKNEFDAPEIPTLELDIVRDADRLEAIGAIGIARAFNYGGYMNRPLFDPDYAPAVYKDKSAYKSSSAPTINHFYEKLLLLKNMMRTKSGYQMAEKRHKFMVDFLHQYYEEAHFQPENTPFEIKK